MYGGEWCSAVRVNLGVELDITNIILGRDRRIPLMVWLILDLVMTCRWCVMHFYALI